MAIAELIWPDDRVVHIAEHGVRPDEVEEVCFGHPLVLRGRSAGKNPVYYVLGQTSVGRYLFCVVIGLPESRGYGVPGLRPTDDEKRGTTFQAVEKAPDMSKIPPIDSIENLARFWDTHDITDFEEDLEEMKEGVFDRGEQPIVRIRLRPEQAEALRRLAESRGMDEADLVKEWVSEKLRAS